MKTAVAALLLFGTLSLAWADDKVASVQQALKDQGFYYGEINGQKDADTTASIRRFQIRNGLQITGDVNDETLKSLHSAPASTPAPAVPPASAAPPNRAITQATPPPQLPDTSDLRDDSASREDEGPPPQARRYLPPEQGDMQPPPPPRVYPGHPGGLTNDNFIGTPYQNSPPEVQHDIVARAQKRLAKRDLFKGPIDGLFSPDLEFSLRAYQSRVGLQRSGRLDLQTLAALELLPGAREPIFTPRRPMPLPPGVEPPVRGEWIRP